MSTFSTKNYEAKEQSFDTYIKPGIVVAKITEIVYGESKKKKTPYLEIHFDEYDPETKKPTGRKGTTLWYLSSNAWEPEKGTGTKWRLVYMADKLAVRQQLDESTDTATSAQDLVEKVNKVFAGKMGRFVFTGEEIAPSDPSKSVWVKAELRPWKFVEDVKTNPTQLTFDPNKDIKKLPVQPNDNMAAAAENPLEETTEEDLW